MSDRNARKAEVVEDAFEEDTDFNLCPRCWISLLIKIVTKPISWESAICKMTKMTETCISPFLNKCKECLLLGIQFFQLCYENQKSPPQKFFFYKNQSKWGEAHLFLDFLNLSICKFEQMFLILFHFCLLL